MIKKIFTFLIAVGLVAGASYMYKVGNDTVKEASVNAQKETTVMNAVDRLEDLKKVKDFSYGLHKKYELPDKTLWQISIEKWGAVETCDILEQRPKIDFSIKSEDYEKVVKLFNDNKIDYKTTRELGE